MASEDRTIAGLGEVDLLWVLIALANGTVEAAATAAVFGVPEAVVARMLTMADLRGQAAVAQASLALDRVPPCALVRADDVALVLDAVRAWVPRTVGDGPGPLAVAVARLAGMVQQGPVWTNN